MNGGSFTGKSLYSLGQGWLGMCLVNDFVNLYGTSSHVIFCLSNLAFSCVQQQDYLPDKQPLSGVWVAQDEHFEGMWYSVRFAIISLLV